MKKVIRSKVESSETFTAAISAEQLVKANTKMVSMYGLRVHTCMCDCVWGWVCMGTHIWVLMCEYICVFTYTNMDT